MNNDVEEQITDDVYIRSDLERTTGNVAFYRLTKDMRDFLNLCKDKHGIEGIILDKKEDGSYSFNIGFILGEEVVKEADVDKE